MATLAEQLESALEGTGSAMSASNIEDMLSGTATSITPGTVTPISPQQSNQQSWNQVFSKIGEGVALKPGEGLPEVPKNIPASTFYRTATQAGKLPSGGSQFFTKPLAPETKPWKLADTPATTPSTTSATTSQQNIVRQMQEAVDLSPQDDSMDDTEFQKSFEEGTGWAKQENFDWDKRYDKDIKRGPTTLADHEQLNLEYSELAYDAAKRGDFRALERLGFSPDQAEIARNRAEAKERREWVGGSDISIKDVWHGRKDLGDYVTQGVKGTAYDVVNYLPKLWDNIYHKPGPTIGGAAFSYGAAKALNLGVGNPFAGLVKPLADAIFSEGMGQIGTTGIVSDDYWGVGGADHGTSTFSSVYGFANVPGYSVAVAVDKYGNILASASGNIKGVTMYGPATKKGQEAWNNKQKVLLSGNVTLDKRAETMARHHGPRSGQVVVYDDSDYDDDGVGSGDSIENVTGESSGDVAGI